MVEELVELLEHAGRVISLVGVGVILGGFLRATVRYAFAFSSLGATQAFSQFKVGLGRALVLGLEILVVSDVIETITVEPSFRSLLVLGLLVILRTFVSWTLTLEIEGRWPWQPAGSG